ncbi:ATP-binding protein [Herbaspirillum hiltneri]|uniref:ATP-binding protein n=1 Tax=Herbaspirillum hiltneri TaxID=341045 RepID=UPI0022858F23|nr:ATP-binding protein [Herbaspirillum hiltneri]
MIQSQLCRIVVWFPVFFACGDPTIADAVLNRVVHQAYKIQLKGESMRKTRGKNSLAEE